MPDFLAHPLVRAGLLFLAIAVLSGIGALVVSRFRGSNNEVQLGGGEFLTKFRDLHAQGVLSDEEYRNIKTLLSRRIQQELNDSEKTG